jgi:hypothetical protein
VPADTRSVKKKKQLFVNLIFFDEDLFLLFLQLQIVSLVSEEKNVRKKNPWKAIHILGVKPPLTE